MAASLLRLQEGTINCQIKAKKCRKICFICKRKQNKNTGDGLTVFLKRGIENRNWKSICGDRCWSCGRPHSHYIGNTGLALVHISVNICVCKLEKMLQMIHWIKHILIFSIAANLTYHATWNTTSFVTAWIPIWSWPSSFCTIETFFVLQVGTFGIIF